MTWPTEQTKTNFDAGADDPKQARSEFAANVDLFNQLRNHVTSFMQTFLSRSTASAARSDLSAFHDNVSATSRVLGRKTAGAGAVEEMTLSEVLNFIGSATEGDILYRASGAWARLARGSNGQVLKLASGIPSWADEAGSTFTWLSQSTGGAATSIDVTGIGSGASEVAILYDQVNVDADDFFLTQLGDSGGVETSGYNDSRSFSNSGTSFSGSGFPVRRAAGNVSGLMTLHRPTGNLWVQGHSGSLGAGGGSKTLSGTLTRIRLQRVTSGNFQSGTVYVGYR